MKRWYEISDDPNCVAVSQARREALQAVRSGKQIQSRVDYLTKVVAGRKILDVGVVAHTREAIDDPDWLHGHLRRSASQCLGVDILEESVAFLLSQGFNVRLADITQQPLDERFDVITAGEVLEHIGEPARFMKHCSMMLEPKGRLLVSVPNPWYINVILKNLRKSSMFVDSADHVAWYDANAIYELAQRNGLELVAYSGIAIGTPATWRARVFFRLGSLLMKIGAASEIFAKSILYEFVRADDAK